MQSLCAHRGRGVHQKKNNVNTCDRKQGNHGGEAALLPDQKVPNSNLKDMESPVGAQLQCKGQVVHLEHLACFLRLRAGRQAPQVCQMPDLQLPFFGYAIS